MQEKIKYNFKNFGDYFNTTVQFYHEAEEIYRNIGDNYLIYYGFEVVDEESKSIVFYSLKKPIYVKNLYETKEDMTNKSIIPAEVMTEIDSRPETNNKKINIYAATIEKKFNIEKQEEVIYNTGIKFTIDLASMN